MDRRPVQLQIAGQSYRVVSSAPEAELKELADVVTSKIADIVPAGRVVPPQAMLLAAIALAHDLAAERSRRESLEIRTRDILRRVLMRIDDAIEPLEEAEPAPGQ